MVGVQVKKPSAITFLDVCPFPLKGKFFRSYCRLYRRCASWPPPSSHGPWPAPATVLLRFSRSVQMFVRTLVCKVPALPLLRELMPLGGLMPGRCPANPSPRAPPARAVPATTRNCLLGRSPALERGPGRGI